VCNARLPLPLDLPDSSDWNESIGKLRSSTHLVLSGGSLMYVSAMFKSCAQASLSNLKVGRVSQSAKTITSNVVAAANAAAAHVGGWNNVRALFVKTPMSVSVPIYTAAPLSAAVARELRQQLVPAADKTRKPRRSLPNNAHAILEELGIEWSGDGSDTDTDDDNDDDDNERDANANNDDDDDDDDEDHDDKDDDEASTIEKHLAKMGAGVSAAVSRKTNRDDNDDQEENVDDDDDDEASADVINKVRKPHAQQAPPASAAAKLAAKAAARAPSDGKPAAKKRPTSAVMSSGSKKLKR
jgi:hypothetical protein